MWNWIIRWVSVACCLGPVNSFAAEKSPQQLAQKIDELIDVKLAAEGVTPQPPAGDAEFLRRVTLDLTGRIPSTQSVYSFLNERDPQKRAHLIDELVESPRYASHFAAVWRAALTPEIAALPEARLFQTGFESWLREQFRQNRPYDLMVRELLSSKLSRNPEAPTPALRRPQDPNPLAFFAVKEAKPENLAATTTRVFLGVQMECAQCHDHPFARWTRDQFWNQAAFFAGLERTGEGLFAPIFEDSQRHDIRPGEGKLPIKAMFLDDTPFLVKSEQSPREEFARWVTKKGNPFFATAAVNRIWGQLFGIGLVDPVDDFQEDNPPSHPELLKELAKAFEESDFDVRYLIQALCRTRAYQRTSAGPPVPPEQLRLYARMPIKAMSGEQFFDSLLRAIGTPEGPQHRAARSQFLDRFAIGGKLVDPETSIPQALTLMNGNFVAEATRVDTSPTLRAACDLPRLDLSERVELLYIAALGRKPTPKEQERIQKQFQNHDELSPGELLADLFWVLLNSAEFRLNH